MATIARSDSLDSLLRVPSELMEGSEEENHPLIRRTVLDGAVSNISDTPIKDSWIEMGRGIHSYCNRYRSYRVLKRTLFDTNIGIGLVEGGAIGFLANFSIAEAFHQINPLPEELSKLTHLQIRNIWIVLAIISNVGGLLGSLTGVTAGLASHAVCRFFDKDHETPYLVHPSVVGVASFAVTGLLALELLWGLFILEG